MLQRKVIRYLKRTWKPMNNKEFSTKQERTVATYLDWNVVYGSGAVGCRPGDLTSNNWLGECKTHSSPDKKIQFKEQVYNKIFTEASSRFKYPILIVDDGTQNIKHTWCCIPNSVRSDIEHRVILFPYSYRKNIIFDHSAMLRQYNISKQAYGIPSIYSASLGDHDVLIMRLQVFKYLYLVT